MAEKTSIKKGVATNIRTKISEINDYIEMINDLALEIEVSIVKNKDGKFFASITQEV